MGWPEEYQAMPVERASSRRHVYEELDAVMKRHDTEGDASQRRFRARGAENHGRRFALLQAHWR